MIARLFIILAFFNLLLLASELSFNLLGTVLL
jgi:hypothetical protein